MADFEGLIRDALAKTDGNNPATRQKVYQSARNALIKMLQKAPGLASDAVEARKARLEADILRIEAGYAARPKPVTPRPAAPAPPPAPVPPPVTATPKPTAPVSPAVTTPEAQTVQTPQSATVDAYPPQAQPAQPKVQTTQPTVAQAQTPKPSPAPQQQAQAQAATAPQPTALPPEDFASAVRSKKRMSLRLLGFVGIIGIIAITGGLGYLLFNTLSGNNPVTADAVRDDPDVRARSRPTIVQSETPGSYIDILDNANPAAIITDGRGEASIVQYSGEKILRIASIRPEDKRRDQAPPMLLELQPGVLNQIEGKKVTFIISAKSGAANRAQFMVECQFGQAGSCGRKRFPLGIQPENAVFSVEMADSIPEGTKAYLAINTDVTTSAAITGKGDLVDILSVRIGLP